MPSPEDQARFDQEIKDLLADARANPHDHLGILLERHRRGLKILAHRFAPAVLDIEYGSSALVQETFTEASRSFEQFHGVSEAQVRAWLASIMRAIVIELYRRQMRQSRDPRREVEWDAGSSGPSTEPIDPAQLPADEIAILHEQIERTRAAIQHLPEELARIVYLHFEEGLSLPEIADSLGRTLGSVRHAWRRAATLLRDWLEYKGGLALKRA